MYVVWYQNNYRHILSLLSSNFLYKNLERHRHSFLYRNIYPKYFYVIHLLNDFVLTRLDNRACQSGFSPHQLPLNSRWPEYLTTPAILSRCTLLSTSCRWSPLTRIRFTGLINHSPGGCCAPLALTQKSYLTTHKICPLISYRILRIIYQVCKWHI